MNTFGNETKSKSLRGINLAGFVTLWLLVCIITAAATIYKHEIKSYFCGLTDTLGLHRTVEKENLPNCEINFNSGKPDIPDREELQRAGDERARKANRKDLPALNSAEQENLKALSEELKKPIKALCDFLKTDNIKYFYKALPPDCIAYLKEKFADAIILLGGESSAVKNALDEDLTGYESVTGKLIDINCEIYEMTETNKPELSEMNEGLHEFGLKQDIKRGYKLRLKLNFRGELASVTADKTIRLTETEAGWFIFFGDLIRSELQ